MKQFFKFMFASMLGTFLMIVIIFLVTFGIVAAIVAAASSEEVVISKKTLLHVKLDKAIVDRSSKTKFVMGYAGPDRSIGLNDILDNFKKAKQDENIAGIYLDLDDVPAGISTVNEIRDGLIDFKSSGKFIWAYSEVYSQKTYYLASVADKIFLNPQGIIEFKGISWEVAFLKGLFSKLDIQPQIIRHGKFKAATEPFFLDKMSDENRQQIMKIINDVWDDMLIGISESRKISRQDLNRIADSVLLQTPADALRLKFVDQLIYKDELIAEFKKKLDLDAKKKIEYVSMDSYTNVPDTKKAVSGSNKIAIIYASGSIAGGEGNDGSIGSERI